MSSREWLEVQTGATTDAPIAANGVIRAPGDQRVLVVFGAGARGKRVALDLVRTASPPEDTYLPIAQERHAIVDLTLSAAPWEE
jgi:large repetitive protein